MAAIHTVCTLHDGHAGNARQAQALARALGHAEAADLVVRPGPVARLLSPRRWPGAAVSLGQAFGASLQAPPKLAIGCGRQAALATRLLRERGSRAVQILDPRIDPRHWDIVVVPEHDRLRADNVVTLLGSLHPVDDIWLAQARAQFGQFAGLPSPRIALLVGGPGRHWPLDDVGFARALQEVVALVRAAGGSLLASASRRTPETWRQALAQAEPQLPGLRWRDARDGANLYAGMLAFADAIACTPDSVNMLSEACATHVPVAAVAAEVLQGRPRAFLDALRARRRVQTLDALDALADAPPAGIEPLRETARIAAEVSRRLALTPQAS